jgi:FtsX-like permease family/MacB-like periplasmic core domain
VIADRTAAQVASYRFRATFGRRWGGYLTLAVLIGLLGGVAMASLVAARRTDSSYPKFLAGTNPSDLIVQPNGGCCTYRDALHFVAQIGRLPHVKQMETATTVQAATITPHGGIGTVLQSQVQLISSSDGMFSDQDRVTITAGRAVNPAHPDEVVASTRAAAALGLHVGSRVPVGVWSSSQKKITPFYRKLDLTVVGIGVFNTQVLQDDIDSGRTGFLLGAPALAREFGSCCTSDAYVGLQLTGGSRDDTTVAREYEGLENTSPFYAKAGSQILQVLQVYDTSDIEAEAQRAIRPEAIALGVFAVIAGLAALLTGVQSISRQLQAGSGDTEILRGLGASPAATTADGLPGIIGAIAAGSVLAAAVTVGLSPLTLFGPVRSAEPSAGIYLDAAVLGLGALFLFAVLGVVAVVIGYRLAPHRAAARGQAGRRGSGAVRAALAAGLPAPVVAGTRFALEPGHGRTAVPVRSVITGAVLAIGVVMATLTFGASLSTLVSHPALYGWNFSYALYSTDGWGPFPPQVTQLLDHDRSVQAATGVYFLTVQIDRPQQTIPAILSPVRPAVGPRILHGHGLDSPGQIVLGPATLAQLHKRIGDTVQVYLGNVIRGTKLRIVGTAALPTIGDTLGVHASLGTGALFATTVVPAPVFTREYGPESGPNSIFVRLRPGTSQTAGLRSLQKIAGEYNRLTHSPRILAHAGPSALQIQASVLPVQRPAEIVNYKTMGTLPAILAGGLAAGAVAALGLTLVASVRRRRRDFALLKTLGFTRRQLAAAIAWQSTVIITIGLIVGVPLGIAAGRWLWLLFAGELSAVPDPVVPATSIALAALAALVLANLVAALPGRSAARTRAALVLRSE